MAAHAETCIAFQIGEKFAAIGFLRAREANCYLEDALRRLQTKHPVTNDDDWRWLHACRSSLPAELRGCTLVTARRAPGRGLYYSALQLYDEEWQEFSVTYARQCDESYLVICRVM